MPHSRATVRGETLRHSAVSSTQAGEEAQFDDASLVRVERFQADKRVIELRHVGGLGGGKEDAGVQVLVEAFDRGALAAFTGELAARIAHHQPAHHDGREGEKLLPVAPVGLGGAG